MRVYQAAECSQIQEAVHVRALVLALAIGNARQHAAPTVVQSQPATQPRWPISSSAAAAAAAAAASIAPHIPPPPPYEHAFELDAREQVMMQQVRMQHVMQHVRLHRHLWWPVLTLIHSPASITLPASTFPPASSFPPGRMVLLCKISGEIAAQIQTLDDALTLGRRRIPLVGIAQGSGFRGLGFGYTFQRVGARA